MSTEPVWVQKRTIAERNRLALQNDGLALKIANRLIGSSPLEKEDLIQLCRIGLLKAIERFDPGKGVAFSSFAVPYIEGEVAHYLRDHFGMVKIPRRAFEASAAVKRTARKLEARCRTIDPQKIAQAHGMTPARWAWTQEAVARKPLTNIDDCIHLGAEDTDLETVERQRLRDRLMNELAKLPQLKRDCLIEHYFGQLSHAEIARRYRKTPPEIRILIEQSIAHLTRRLTQEQP